jgi:hypothetical protein
LSSYLRISLVAVTPSMTGIDKSKGQWLDKRSFEHEYWGFSG